MLIIKGYTVCAKSQTLPQLLPILVTQEFWKMAKNEIQPISVGPLLIIIIIFFNHQAAVMGCNLKISNGKVDLVLYP